MPATDPAPKVAAQVKAEEDPTPELQYHVAMGWMRRGDRQKARQAFQELAQRYPTNRFAREARAQLEKLPAQPAADSTARDPNVPHIPSREEAITQWRARYEAESRAGRPHTITDDDIRGISRTSGRVKPVEPPLPTGRSSAGEAGPQNPGSDDQLSLTSVRLEGEVATLRVAYRLGPHARTVYAGARVLFPAPNTGYFSYGAEALTPGTGETVITVHVGSGSPALLRPTSVRLMFFEAQGAMFFSREVPWP